MEGLNEMGIGKERILFVKEEKFVQVSNLVL